MINCIEKKFCLHNICVCSVYCVYIYYLYYLYHCYADDTQLYLSFHPDDLTIAARISACLIDISCWMMDHHLQLNLAKTELLVVSANPSFHYNFTFQLGSSTITPSKTARNLGVVIDDKLNFSDLITKTVWSCRFALYNIKKIRPLGTCNTTPCSGSCFVLVLFCSHYCTIPKRYKITFTDFFINCSHLVE